MASHVSEYLSYYKTCISPGYAVLVTGDWGVGKTHQVRQSFKKEEYWYVSLFGLQSVEEIHSAVIAQMLPKRTKTKSFFRRAERSALDVGGLYSLLSIIPSVANAIVRSEIKNDRVIIFDDLERCSLTLEDRLGVINSYVEHHGCRVVVIAHDERIVGDFVENKEKIFGQTLRVEPEVLPAFVSFCESVRCDRQIRFVSSYRKLIIEISQASGAKSLRILKHVIEDIGRIHDSLSSQHLANSDAMAELVALFSALSIEIRNGTLSKDDLRDRARAGYRSAARRLGNQSQNSQNEPPLLVADKKYPSVNLRGAILQDELLVELLIEGRYDTGRLRASLDISHYFLELAATPNWKIIFNYDDLEDDVVENALRGMEEQFDNREVTAAGDMLHVFALKLMLSSISETREGLEEVSEKCKDYINDLLAADRMPSRDTDWQWKDGFERSFDGYGYWVTEETEKAFKSIYHHLIEAMELSLEGTFPAITNDLIDLVRNDPATFADKVTFSNGGDGNYASVPILAHIPVQAFVSAWLGAPKSNWRTISRALQGRYEANQLNNTLSKEKSWAKEVKEALFAEAEKLEGFRAQRIRRIVPGVLQSL